MNRTTETGFDTEIRNRAGNRTKDSGNRESHPELQCNSIVAGTYLQPGVIATAKKNMELCGSLVSVVHHSKKEESSKNTETGNRTRDLLRVRQSS
jgi:hypothetical protein